MAVREIVFPQEDTAPDLIATLRDRDGIKNVTGATVTFNIRHSDGTFHEIPCDVIVPGTNGKVRVLWPDPFPAPGRYQAEYRVVYTDLTEQTFPSRKPNTLVIRERLS